MGWVAHFDNSDWTPNSAITWSYAYSQWGWSVNGSAPTRFLTDAGTWTDSYEPTKIRITFVGDDASIAINGKDEADGNVFYVYPYTSGEEKDCSWNSSDLNRLLFDAIAGTIFVTNIEFYESEGWSHNFMGVANASINKIDGLELSSIKSVSGVE